MRTVQLRVFFFRLTQIPLFLWTLQYSLSKLLKSVIVLLNASCLVPPPSLLTCSIHAPFLPSIHPSIHPSILPIILFDILDRFPSPSLPSTSATILPRSRQRPSSTQSSIHFKYSIFGWVQNPFALIPRVRRRLLRYLCKAPWLFFGVAKILAPQ
ncbi:hypothetical protein M422DRAFT_775282 [Sphaerobolus stellatus SS14]|nr:hypothetical protein M422DRAFT_775282 [Sphaerobolus stellatus SS14]